MKFRKGDIVSVRGVVEYDYKDDDDSMLFIKIPGHYQSVGLPEDKFFGASVKIEMPFFEAGDSVRWPKHVGSDEFCYGTILALTDGHAWIALGGADYCTRTCSSIERVEIGDGDEAIA